MGPLRIAVVEGDRYSPLYGRLPEFSAGTGHEVEVAVRLPMAELLEHLDTAPEPYHLVSAHSDYSVALAERLLPLDEFLSPEETAAFSDFSLDLCRWEGRLYGLPRSVETRLLFYRSDVFDDRREKQWFAEATGGKELRVPRTWDELAAVAQYFTREGKMHGFAFAGKGPGLVHLFAEIVTAVGGVFFDAEGHPRFLSRAGEWALTLLRDLHTRWEAVPPETPDCTEEEVSELFRLGRCATACDFPDTARLLCDTSFSAVAAWHGVALMPSGAGGRRAAWTGCPTFAIPAGCPDVEAALELLRFLTSRESQALEAGHGALPARTDAYEARRKDLFMGTLDHLRFTVAEQTLGIAALTAPRLPQWPRIERELWPVLRQAVTGEREVVEAMEIGFRLAEEALAPRDSS